MQILPLAPTSWQFRDPSAGSRWRKAVVPGCVHQDLLRHDLIPDPFWGTNELQLQWIEERDWEYQTTFSVPDAVLAEDVIDLVADGLDTVATISLNGHRVASVENMFQEYRWNVKRHLKPGKSTLLIHFGSAMHYIRTHRKWHKPTEINDPVGGSSVIRKEQCQFG